MGRFVDITGRRYGRLVVTGQGQSRSGQTTWYCDCECGNTVNVLKHSLVSGRTLSCGCLMKEKCRALGHAAKTHGMRQTPEYSVWCGMKRRCENQNEKCYPRYGGRGIEVRYDDFPAFLSDVGERPTKRHQIDRIDSNGHYEPGNCQWSLPKQQQRNRRDTFVVEYNGKRASLAEHCEEKGVDYKRAWVRIRRYGWPVERAIT